MAKDFNEFKKAGEGVIDWLKSEYIGIRTGRATPAILDAVSVSAYGSPMHINQLATVSVEGPKSLRVIPWDKGVIKDIDKAVREANLGLSSSIDGEGLRVSFPELTGERRALLIKAAKEKLEEARIRVRNEREKAIGELDRGEKEGTLSKDDKFRLKNDLQKMVDDLNEKLEDLADKKEKEIME